MREPRIPLPPNLRRMALVALVSTLGYFSFSAFLPAYLRDSGVTVVAVGLFFSLTSAVEAPIAIAGGVLADRFGRRPLLAAGRVLQMLGWIVASLLPTALGLVTAAGLLGLAGLSGSAYRALIAESAAEGRRASAFAVIGVVENATGVVVPLAVGVLADRLGLKWVLCGAAALSGILGLVATLRLDETYRPARHKEAGRAAEARGPADAGESDEPAPAGESHELAPAASPLEGFRYLVSGEGRGAALMGVIWLFTGLGMGLLPPVWALYVTDRFGVDYAGLGAVSTSMALGMMVGHMLGGPIADRIGYSRLMALSLCVTVPAWVAMTWATSAWFFAVLTAVSYFVAFIAASAWEALGADAVPRRVRGSAMGVYRAFWAVGLMMGSALAGFAYSKAIVLPFYLLAAADLAMLVLVLAGRRAGLRGFAPAGPTRAKQGVEDTGPLSLEQGS